MQAIVALRPLFQPTTLRAAASCSAAVRRMASATTTTTTSTTSLPAFGQPAFALTKTLPYVSFEEALDKTVHALKDVGFGVLTEIDVDATLQLKIHTALDRPYKILGACNPKFAHEALQKLPAFGLLMPCNVVVTMTDTDDATNPNAAVVSMVDPLSLFAVVQQEPGMEKMAREVREALQTALDAL